jgi:PE family
MSFVLAAPEAMAAAATNLQSIGSALTAAHSAAGAPTTNLLAAAEDEVSAAIASLFGTHAQEYQALSAQATAFHDRFVQSLGLAAGSYAAAEAASTSPLDALGVFSPWKTLTGRPLFGNGTAVTAARARPAAPPAPAPAARQPAVAASPATAPPPAMAAKAGRASPVPTVARAARAATSIAAARGLLAPAASATPVTRRWEPPPAPGAPAAPAARAAAKPATPSRAACPRRCADVPASRAPAAAAGCRRRTPSRRPAPAG